MDSAVEEVGVGAMTALAPAKVNLALHVTGQRSNGYHELDSLVVFAKDGDELSLRQSDEDSLVLDGPFGAGLPADRGNLVLRALDFCRGLAAANGVAVPPLAIHLRKNLPIASGIGGGSADAAALIRLLGAAYPDLSPVFRRESLSLGADVPMCIASLPVRVQGVGEIETPLNGMGGFGMVLANPGHAISTPAAFAGLSRRSNASLPALPDCGFPAFKGLTDYLLETRNDLEPPALALVPSIADVSDALAKAGAGFVRMSGSGATVFGLFETSIEANKASATIQGAHPDWWVLSTRVRAIP